MRKRVLGFVFAAALLVAIAVPLFGTATTYAAAQLNGNGCNSRGVAISNYDNTLRGSQISALAQSAPGAVAAVVHSLQTCPAP